MATPLNILVEVSPLNGSTPVTLRLASIDADPIAVTANGQSWLPCINVLPKQSVTLSKDGTLDNMEISRGEVGFVVSSDFANSAWTTYKWSGAFCQIWVGEKGAPFSDYIKYFQGKVSSLSREGIQATFALLGPEADLTSTVLTLEYAGTGDAEGPASLKGKAKPRCYGSPRSVEPVEIDPIHLVYQVHAYGPVQSIVPYEYGAPLTSAQNKGNAANYATLCDMTLVPGEYATCLAEGMFRFGGTPTPKVSADVVMASGNSLSDIAEAVLLDASVPVSAIGDFGAFGAVETDLYITEETEALDLLFDLFKQAGGYIFPDSEGVWQCGEFYQSSKPAVVLKSNRSAFPVLLNWKEDATQAPVWRVKYGYERCWGVHADSDASPLINELAGDVAAAKDAAENAENTALAAKSAADVATAAINSFTSDSKLDPSEKKHIVALMAEYAANKPLYEAQADQFSITAEKTAYQNAYTILLAYLGGLSPAYDDFSTSTTIDRDVFRQKFADYHTAQTNLLLKWAKLSKTEWKGAWNSSTTYNRGDSVTYNGRSFVSATDNNTGNTPPSTATSNTYWTLIADKGADGPTLSITPSKAGFTFLDGKANPATQTITFTAKVEGQTVAVDWTTAPNIKVQSNSSTFSVTLADLGTNESFVVTAIYKGSVAQAYSLTKIADSSATVGAPVGTPVAGRPAEQVIFDLDDIVVRTGDLEDIYGDTVSAAQSAADAAKALAMAKAARGNNLVVNGDFSAGKQGWTDAYNGDIGVHNETTMTAKAFQGATNALVNDSLSRKDTRMTEPFRVVKDRTYRVTFEYFASGGRIVLAYVRHNLDGTYHSWNSFHDETGSTSGWKPVTYDYIAAADHFMSPGAITNFSSNGVNQAFRFVSIVDVTESLDAKAQATAALVAKGDAQTAATTAQGAASSATEKAAAATQQAQLTASYREAIKKNNLVLQPNGNLVGNLPWQWSNSSRSSSTIPSVAPSGDLSIEVYGDGVSHTGNTYTGNIKGRKYRFSAWVNTLAANSRFRLLFRTAGGGFITGLEVPTIDIGKDWHFVEFEIDVQTDTTTYTPATDMMDNDVSPFGSVYLYDFRVEDITDLYELTSDVKQMAGALASASGRQTAYWQVETNTNSGSQAFISARSDSQTDSATVTWLSGLRSEDLSASSAGMTVSMSSSAGNAHKGIWSKESYTGSAYISWQVKIGTNERVLVGLTNKVYNGVSNEDPTAIDSVPYRTCPFALTTWTDGYYRIFENGTTAQTLTEKPRSTDVVSISYESGNQVVYRINDREVRRSTTTSGQTLWAFAAPYSPGSAARNIRFLPQTTGSTSSVSIGAREFAVYNPAGGGWVKALTIANGNALFSGGLQAGAYIRLGTGEGWPVALKPRDFKVSDGEVVSFGTTLDGLPNLSWQRDNLAPLGTGETYNIYAQNLTTTGFTARLRINVPAVPTNYSKTSDVAGASGEPTRVIDKSSDPNSQDGIYTISYSGTATLYGFYQNPDGEIP